MKRLLSLLTIVSIFSAIAPVEAGFFDKTYFPMYIAQYCSDFSVYRYEKPYDTQSLPELMTPQAIATDIANKVNPASFLRGASTSEHQCSQQCTPEICSWSRFAKERNLPQPSDKQNGMNWWKYYPQYIDYAADTMKLNSLRFSIEWPLIQPQGPDSWNHEVLDHYADVFIYALKKGITPVVCFHHYTDPNWFLDRGGFEKEVNNDYFVHYCQKVYEHIMDKISRDSLAYASLSALALRPPLWATFNAPDGYAFRGYQQKQGPPADPTRAGLKVVTEVLKNTLESHVRVYYALKKVYADKKWTHGEPQVGFLKNIHQIDSAKDTWKHYCAAPLTRFIAGVADMIQNGSVYRFFTEGEYRVHVPFLINMTYKNPAAVGALDFIGLNYYSNRHLFLTKTIEPTDETLCSDNKVYYHYPEGLYRAIHELHDKIVAPYEKQGKKLPLIVAENGIATKDDQKRKRFYHEYLYAINKALQEGKVVTGYLPWTLATNYEWPSLENNVERDYGLCSVNEHDQSQLQVKPGTSSYMEFVAQMQHAEKKVA